MDARASDGGVDLGPRVRVFCVLFQLFPFKARNISRPQNNAIQQLKSHDPGETIQHTTYICVEGQPRNTRPSRTRVHTSPRARTPRTMSLRVPLAGRSRDARARPSLRRVMTRPRCDDPVTTQITHNNNSHDTPALRRPGHIQSTHIAQNNRKQDTPIHPRYWTLNNGAPLAPAGQRRPASSHLRRTAASPPRGTRSLHK